MNKSIIKMQITKRKCKSLTDIRTIIAMSKSKKYKKIPNRHIVLKRIFASNYSWQKRIAWLDRIIDFDGPRVESIEYQIILHNSKEIAQNLYDKKVNSMLGKANPGYNHNGKFSIFSDKYIGKGNKAMAVNKMKKTILENPQNQNTKIDYYLAKGYDNETAKTLLMERQSTVSLQNYKKRYGNDVGLKKWKERNKKWQETLNNKPIEELARINSQKSSKGYSVSKAENDLFKILKENFVDIEKAFVIFYNENKNYYVYDMVLKNKIIEYNGDFWHANPKIYNESFINSVSKMTFEQILKKENSKEMVAINNGYELLRIWESDYKQNKDKAIEECMNFLMK